LGLQITKTDSLRVLLHTSDWQISLRLLETITPLETDSKGFYWSHLGRKDLSTAWPYKDTTIMKLTPTHSLYLYYEVGKVQAVELTLD